MSPSSSPRKTMSKLEKCTQELRNKSHWQMKKEVTRLILTQHSVCSHSDKAYTYTQTNT